MKSMSHKKIATAPEGWRDFDRFSTELNRRFEQNPSLRDQLLDAQTVLPAGFDIAHAADFFARRRAQKHVPKQFATHTAAASAHVMAGTLATKVSPVDDVVAVPERRELRSRGRGDMTPDRTANASRSAAASSVLVGVADFVSLMPPPSP